MMTFKEKVLQIVRNIPSGETKSYQEVAALAGNSKAARVVGNILSSNRDLLVPCHRVIKKNGDYGKYNGLLGASKKELLRKESLIELFRETIDFDIEVLGH